MLNVQQAFYNLPVRDLDRAKDFFAHIVFELFPQYKSEMAACLNIRDTTFVMQVTEDFFRSGLPCKQIVDNNQNVESIIALALDSREEVDRRTELATSFEIACESQEEIDYFWQKLAERGQTQQCGWLQDRFGLSWQVTPAELPQLMEKNPKAVMDAYLAMTKVDIAQLRAAAQQG